MDTEDEVESFMPLDEVHKALFSEWISGEDKKEELLIRITNFLTEEFKVTNIRGLENCSGTIIH